jgi:hypothetical protein
MDMLLLVQKSELNAHSSTHVVACAFPGVAAFDQDTHRVKAANVAAFVSRLQLQP